MPAEVTLPPPDSSLRRGPALSPSSGYETTANVRQSESLQLFRSKTKRPLKILMLEKQVKKINFVHVFEHINQPVD